MLDKASCNNTDPLCGRRLLKAYPRPQRYVKINGIPSMLNISEGMPILYGSNKLHIESQIFVNYMIHMWLVLCATLNEISNVIIEKMCYSDNLILNDNTSLVCLKSYIK